MEVWIKSQDGREIRVIKSLWYEAYYPMNGGLWFNLYGSSTGDISDGVILGVYKNNEEVVDVLDEFADYVTCQTANNRTVFELPQKGFNKEMEEIK